MGETANAPFQLSLDTALEVEFQESRVTSDGRQILVRELDERLVFSDLIAQYITDPRGTNTQFPLTDLAYVPPDQLGEELGAWAALTSRVHSFQPEVLAQEANLAALAAINRELIRKGGSATVLAAGRARSG
jgi:hypothetical protein